MPLSDAEYELQLYGFTRDNVCKFVKESLHEIVKEAIEGVARKMKRKYSGEEVNKCFKYLTAAYQSSIDSHAAELETIVEKLFSIPPEVLLPEDEIQAESMGNYEEEELDRKIEAAERKLIALNMMEINLTQCVKSLTNSVGMRQQIQQLKSTVDFLEANCNEVALVVEKCTPSLVEKMLDNMKQ